MPLLPRVLLDTAHAKSFKGVVASRADKALEQVHQLDITAITLDIHLPDMDGWVLLDQLKRDPKARHIPVDS